VAPNDLAARREQAWIGDAVLALFAREWLLANRHIKPDDRPGEFIALTSNEFLACIGEPTSVEATIGKTYQAGGLQAAFQFIEETLLPLYLKQRKNR